MIGSLDFEEPIQITRRLYQNEDIQVLEYRSKELDGLTPLEFDPAFLPSVGETVYLYEFDKIYEGVISHNDQAQRSYTVKMTQAYPAGGNSGSPVVSAKNGKVVGVMLKADHPKEAKTVVFELLAPKKTP